MTKLNNTDPQRPHTEGRGADSIPHGSILVSPVRWIFVAGILCAGVWAFGHCVHNPFHFDDALFLQSPQVAVPGDATYLLGLNQTRQLTYLTFYLNYRIAQDSPWSYHLVNLILHLANVVAVFVFSGLLIVRMPGRLDTFAIRWVPVAAAGIFALHPVQSEAVNYVYQRSTLLATFFSLLCLAACLRAESVRRKGPLLTASALFFILAVASMEEAFILPLVWVALLWAESGEETTFRAVAARSRWLLPTILAAACGGGWVLHALHKHGESTAGIAGWRQSLHYLMSEIQVLATYLRILVWPSGLSLDHEFRPAPFLSLYAILCCLLLALIVLAALLTRRRWALPAFLIAAFLILLAPTSSLIPSADLLFEHRLYLPMAAFSILAAWVILGASRLACVSNPRNRAAAVLVMAGLLSIWGWMSRERTLLWGDNISLWSDSAAKSPGKARPHYNLGIALIAHDPARARTEFLETVRLQPDHSAALYNLGWLEQSSNRFDSATEYYRRAIQADPDNWQAHQNLGNLEILRGSAREAAQDLREVIRLKPDYWPAYRSLAILQLGTGDYASAVQTLLILEKQTPDPLDARYLLAQALMGTGRLAEAQAELRAIAARDSRGVFLDRVAALQQKLDGLSSLRR